MWCCPVFHYVNLCCVAAWYIMLHSTGLSSVVHCFIRLCHVIVILFSIEGLLELVMCRGSATLRLPHNSEGLSNQGAYVKARHPAAPSVSCTAVERMQGPKAAAETRILRQGPGVCSSDCSGWKHYNGFRSSQKPWAKKTIGRRISVKGPEP